MAATWLKDTVFYEIYPQSYLDSNGDGIGDIAGITGKLDYIKSLGCNAVWINPCFDSPFKDAGYDVRDYKKVAERYGTNEDLYRLFEEAHKRDMRIVLDLVPGHTSEEHEWFLKSRKDERNEYSDRYIWTGSAFEAPEGLPYVGGESERSGTYVLNFFKCQPALNYGFLHPDKPWQMPMDHPGAMATREAIKDVMRFWLSHGCDGFRVDMAGSLVKNDDERKSGTTAVWRDVRRMLDAEYPDAAMIAEWSAPKLALRAGFDSDFCLNDHDNGYRTLMRDYEDYPDRDRSYFRKDAGGNINRFLDLYIDWYEDTKDIGYISMFTCNHDTVRPKYNLTDDELKLAYAFIFTMPGLPFLYYGDEIGMRYLDIPTKEGGYFRTGSRTPMQWNHEKNLGFSTAGSEELYLPVDNADDAPTVADQEKDPASLLNTVRSILALRHAHADLQADAPLKILLSEPGRPLIYSRGEMLIVLNTTGSTLTAEAAVGKRKIIFVTGEADTDGDRISIGAQSFAVLG
jgi:maltose alpha-D-glucosyltransferase/alpha-amylase